LEEGLNTQEYGHPVSQTALKIARVRRITSIVIGVLLFIVVIIYAGVRGHLAYGGTTAISIVFEPEPVAFPAITVCPLVPTLLQALVCVKETSLVVDSDCISTVYQKQFTIEGLTHNCLTFNDPKDPTQILISTTTKDELAIRVYINASDVPADEAIGALVLLHVQGIDPTLSLESSFVSDVGKLTEVWLRLDILEDEQRNHLSSWYTASHSAVSYKEVKPGDALSVMDIDLQFAQQGAYDNIQYYVYTPDNWIGEVGGFTCLMWFLHWAVLNIIVGIATLANRNRG